MKKTNRNPLAFTIFGSTIGEWFVIIMLAMVLIFIFDHFHWIGKPSDPISKLNPPATREELSRYKVVWDGKDWRVGCQLKWHDASEWTVLSSTYNSSNDVLHTVAYLIQGERDETNRAKPMTQLPLDKVFNPPATIELQSSLETTSNRLEECFQMNAEQMVALHDFDQQDIMKLKLEIESLKQSKQDKVVDQMWQTYTNLSRELYITNCFTTNTVIQATNTGYFMYTNATQNRLTIPIIRYERRW